MWWSCVVWASVVLNEALIDPTGVDAGSEWVELIGVGACTSVSGWRVQSALRAYGEGVVLPDEVLCAGDRLWVGGSESSAPFRLPAGQRFGFGNASSSGDAIRLVDSTGGVRDIWVYGPDNADGFVDESGGLAVPVVAPSAGQSLGRRLDGFDTDAAADLTLFATPTPGARNQNPGCDSAADVGLRITELMADPEGPDEGREWIELVAVVGQADVSGYRIRAGGSQLRDVAVLPPNTILPVNVPLLIGPATGDLELDVWFGNGSGGDRVEILDCYGDHADAVVYGTDSSDGWTWASGQTEPVPLPPAGRSLGRWRTLDTDSAVDFVDQQPDPGVFEPGLPRSCRPNPGTLRLSEVHPTDEWVELFAAGPDPVTITGWTIGGVSLEGVVAVGEHRVVDVPGLPQRVELLDCQGEQVDAWDASGLPAGQTWSFGASGWQASSPTPGGPPDELESVPIRSGCGSNRPELPEPTWAICVLVGVARRRSICAVTRANATGRSARPRSADFRRLHGTSRHHHRSPSHSRTGSSPGRSR